MNITETVAGSYIVVTSTLEKKGARKQRVEHVREVAATTEAEARAAYLRRYPDAESADGFRWESVKPETRTRPATREEIAQKGNAWLASRQA